MCYLYFIDLCIGKFIQYNIVVVMVVYKLLMMVDGLVIVFNVMGWEDVIEVVEVNDIVVFIICWKDKDFEEYISLVFEELVMVY